MSGNEPDPRQPALPLDAFDLKILSTLAERGRISWSDLSEEVGLSQTPTVRRVRALEAKGYISGYRATFDEARFGGALTVFVWVSLEKQTDELLRRFEDYIVRIPGVLDCYMMTGTADFLLRAGLPDMASFQTFISAVTEVPGVARINTSFAVKAVVQRALPPLLSGAGKMNGT